MIIQVFDRNHEVVEVYTAECVTFVNGGEGLTCIRYLDATNLQRVTVVPPVGGMLVVT